MATQFSNLLKIALPTQGELSGSWGDVVNNNITSMVEEAIAGLKTINTWSGNSATLSTANGTTAESRAAMLLLTDSTSDLSGAANLICPALSKVYIVKNGTGQAVTVKTASGSGIAVANGNTSLLFCDGTNVVEAVTGITGNLDVGGNLTVGGNATVTGTTTFNGGTLTLGDSAADNVVFGADVNSSIIPNTDSTFDLGSASQEWRDIYIDRIAYLDSINLNGTAITSTAAEINILDGVTATTAEINLIDGGATVGTTAIADGDGLIINDAGTMRVSTVQTLAAYLDDEITAMPNLVTTAATAVGVLNSGSITSGFGTIDTGSSTITTTGLITGGSLDIDDVVINGTTIGHTDDTDLITLADGSVTIAGDLTISGDDLTMATNTAGHLLIADGTNFNPTPVTGLSEISTVANDDVFLAVDTSGGGLKKITRSAVVAGLATSSAISNVSEDSTPQLGGNLDLNGNDIVTTSNATLDLAPNGTGTVVVRGNTNSGAIVFNCESNSHGQTVIAQPHSASVTNTMLLPAGASSTLVSLVSTDTLTNKTLTSPKINEDVAVTSTATELNVLDGITAVVGELNALDLGSTAVGTAIASKAVILDSNKDYTGIRNFTVSGELDAATGDFSGDVDVDGTLEADAITVNGTALATVIAGTTVTNATNSAHVLVTDNESTNEENLIAFVEGATSSTGNVGLEMDGNFAYNPSTGTVSATVFKGNIDAVDVDVDGTLEADAITIGGTAIASVLSPVAGSSSIVTTGALNAGSITSGFGAIDNGASAITTTGVITGGTLEATTDTAAGDNAAIGYTSAEGLILTGQGSTSDVVIKNDADATVVSIATGTTILTMADDVFVTGRAAGTMTTDNDGNLDLAVSNNFKVTTGGDLTLTLTNPAIGQSGNILFINASDHTISAHASLLINADVLTAISASGSYHLTYYATATSGNNTILVSASAILT